MLKHSILGVDTGGTFTDVIVRQADGQLHVHKLLSTPHDPSQAIVDGVRHVIPQSQMSTLSVVHGTTVATNALLERAGAKIAFVTNAGFEDLLFLKRQHRPQLYGFTQHMPAPIVTPELCFGVRGRMDEQGQEIEALVESDVQHIVDEVKRHDVDAIAVVLLHAYANPAHEVRIGALLAQALPEIFLCTSTSISREFREYERACTACANAYIGPVMSQYLARLQRNLHVKSLDVFQSNGTRADAEHVARFPVHTALSGPAGGVMGALAVAKELSLEQIITFDMGGTSTDVSLCLGGASFSDDAHIGGLHIQLPMLDIHTVGAGGGSIASLDHGVALRVGPESAGAWPGPCAYGRGGILPTVTDAHVVLGRLRPDQFLGATMSLDVEAAHRSVQGLADALELGIEATALGILEVADAAMNRAIKVISVERGHDPRQCALVCFGGAGGLHACRLARSLEMQKVIVPRHPGLLSAYGMIHAPQARFFSQTRVVALEAIVEDPVKVALQQDISALQAQSIDALGDNATHVWHVSLRYVGQSFTLSLEVDHDVRLDQSLVDHLLHRFHALHHREFGWSAQARQVEWVTLRLHSELVEQGANSVTVYEPDTKSAPGDESVQWVDVGFHDGMHRTWIRDRESLAEGQRLSGPGILTEYSSTTIIPPGWSCAVMCGHLVLEVIS